MGRAPLVHVLAHAAQPFPRFGRLGAFLPLRAFAFPLRGIDADLHEYPALAQDPHALDKVGGVQCARVDLRSLKHAEYLAPVEMDAVAVREDDARAVAPDTARPHGTFAEALSGAIESSAFEQVDAPFSAACCRSWSLIIAMDVKPGQLWC
ncbi:hypothetical protein [Solirubrobacter pauli]|uniref:hypothetical protein n=1 Tax=Solirubrobacter pauli TaxID=166793 RepID=UPI0011C4A22D|nr:hypothetical protein [Solirubrobacter pauli]